MGNVKYNRYNTISITTELCNTEENKNIKKENRNTYQKQNVQKSINDNTNVKVAYWIVKT